MMYKDKEETLSQVPLAIRGIQENEGDILARFASRVNDLCPLYQASTLQRDLLLEEVKTLAQRFDGSTEEGSASGYDRRILYEEPDHWSLAAIILRPGQQIQPHDHGGWGCAATVQGVERNRWFLRDGSGNLVLTGERDYPPGTGYVFDAADVHQPVGADPRRVTVALHFLVHESHAKEPQAMSVGPESIWRFPWKK